MDKLKKEFGARIKNLRTSKNFSQAELSEMIGMTSDNLSRIELGKSFPNLENINKIANALDVGSGHLFQDTELSAPTVESIPHPAMLVKEMNKLLISTNTDKQVLIYKIIKAIAGDKTKTTP